MTETHNRVTSNSGTVVAASLPQEPGGLEERLQRIGGFIPAYARTFRTALWTPEALEKPTAGYVPPGTFLVTSFTVSVLAIGLVSLRWELGDLAERLGVNWSARFGLILMLAIPISFLSGAWVRCQRLPLQRQSFWQGSLRWAVPFAPFPVAIHVMGSGFPAATALAAAAASSMAVELTMDQLSRTQPSRTTAPRTIYALGTGFAIAGPAFALIFAATEYLSPRAAGLALLVLPPLSWLLFADVLKQVTRETRHWLLAPLTGFYWSILVLVAVLWVVETPDEFSGFFGRGKDGQVTFHDCDSERVFDVIFDKIPDELEIKGGKPSLIPDVAVRDAVFAHVEGDLSVTSKTLKVEGFVLSCGECKDR